MELLTAPGDDLALARHMAKLRQHPCTRHRELARPPLRRGFIPRRDIRANWRLGRGSRCRAFAWGVGFPVRNMKPELHTALKAAQPGSGTDAAAARFSPTTLLGEINHDQIKTSRRGGDPDCGDR